ncbi:MAG: hypothetical protein FH751_12865 [Firmicutes bacterium]|nr:hypothetical protein [Bacillota bacterium]
MKITIICSAKSNNHPKNPFEMKTDSRFANAKFIPHLKDEKKVCTVCGKDCFWCRKEYNLDFSKNINELIKLPDLYPLFVDYPKNYLPKEFKKSDVFIAVGIHQDILVKLPKLIKHKAKALIVPIEGTNWVSRWVKDKTIDECNKYNIEYAFPKPFCTLEKKNFRTINNFIDEFKIGKPKFRLYVNNLNEITKAVVLQSAPCGNGYNIAKHLKGVKLDEDAKEKVAKYWHSFPCMGGMKIDPEIGDTILHKAGYTHYNALKKAEIIKV